MKETKTVEKRVRFSAEPRPDMFPDDWIVFNAPRPICGHRTMEGTFMHGIFYAGVDPEGEYALDFITNNWRLDADPVQFVTDEEMIALGKKYATEHHSDCDFSDFPDDVFIDCFCRENIIMQSFVVEV